MLIPDAYPMRPYFLRSLAAAAAASVLLSACAETDNMVAPSRTAAPAHASSTLLGSAVSVSPLLRTTPLPAAITVSKSIGVLGGTISIPGAGVTVVVPALALSSTKTISVTALAGSNVAYEFEPHGITFNVPLALTQSLVNTQAAPGGLVSTAALFVGYFPNSSNVTSVTELLGVGIGAQGLTATTSLWHFSGYIFAGGRTDEE